jgi:hypothetical protein
VKLAPYARELAAKVAAGFAPPNGITVLLGWPKRKPHGWRCVVPEKADPAGYDWRWCAGMDVMVVETSLPTKESLRAIGAVLAAIADQAKPRRLLGVSRAAKRVVGL